MWTPASETNVLNKVLKIQQIIRERIPENLVVPEHDEYGHKYRHTPTNQIFSSVTTKTGILENDRLKRWAARLAVEYLDRNWSKIDDTNRSEHFIAATLAHEDELKDAGDIGTQGHGAIERYLKAWIETGTRPDDIRTFIEGVDARLWAITRSAEQFFIDFEVIPIASELKICSVKYKYAGTLDSLMMVRKGEKHIFAIVDFKTSNSIDKPEYVMQVSAYWQGLYEMTGLRPSELLILQLDKVKLKYEVVRIINRPEGFRAFKHVCAVYDYIYSGISKIYKFTPKKETFL